MPVPMMLTIAAVFVSVALFAWAAMHALFTLSATGRKRLRATAAAPTTILPEISLSLNAPLGQWQSLAKVLPRSGKELQKLRMKLMRAGFRSPAAPIIYTIIEYVGPIVAGAVPLLLLERPISLFAAAAAALLVFSAPSLLVGSRLATRRKEIENGLPDALDLFVVCIEAGCGLDQAIVKAGDELALAYPTLSEELRVLTTEIRAGKTRLEAFKNLAQRTKVDDVRALVAMLIQTDRFGTSIGQALRTHAEQSRTKRRQRAEERAQKIGVKLVFPLVLLFFPALFIVLLGPAVLQFMRTMM
jgi:tight adherence protein C